MWRGRLRCKLQKDWRIYILLGSFTEVYSVLSSDDPKLTYASDLTAANILLQLANIDEWSIEEIHDRLGEPQTHVLHRGVGQIGEYSGPKYTVNAISMKLVDPQWLSDQIMIIDFGIAFMEEQSSVDIGTPKNYCAPEFNFKSPRSIGSDIWALGCTIFEIRTGSCLYRYRGIPTRDQMLIATVKILGKLPDAWWDLWEDGRTWYDLEIQSGGQLSEIIAGTLFKEIMKIGLHDGDSHGAEPTHKDLGFGADNADEDENLKRKHHSSSEKHVTTTTRLVALVEELTTSEANYVMAQIEHAHSPGSTHEKSGSSHEKTHSGSVSSNKNQSGSGSGSSGARSGEKSISSEGVSTGATKSRAATIASTAGIATETGADRRLPRSGDIEVPVMIAEFLEPSGTIISVAEAEALENLLRKAMQFLPEDRSPAAELAKHDWFFVNFKGEG